MEFTDKGIPLSLKPAFQEYDIHQLDPERDAFTIIERTLARGKRDELRWLFIYFGSERLVQWIKTNWRILSRRRRLFWRNYFELDEMVDDQVNINSIPVAMVKFCPASCPIQYYRVRRPAGWLQAIKQP